MKTLKIIVFAAIALLGLASCSDERKALDFVSKEVATENNLDDFLIRYKMLDFKECFEPEIRGYLNSIISGVSTYPSVHLSDKYAHYYLCPYDNTIRKISDNWNMITTNINSDIILNTILCSLSERIDTILANDTLKYKKSSFDNMSKEDMFNNILSKAVDKFLSSIQYELRKEGLDPENTELQKIYEYDWNLLGGQHGQSQFIDDILYWALGNCRDEVRSKKYKIVDRECATLGENHFEVTYLLDPKSEIHFDVSKIGKTFVLNSAHVY